MKSKSDLNINGEHLLKNWTDLKDQLQSVLDFAIDSNFFRGYVGYFFQRKKNLLFQVFIGNITLFYFENTFTKELLNCRIKSFF